MKEIMNWKVRGLTLFFVLMLSLLCTFPQNVSARETVQAEQQRSSEEGTTEQQAAAESEVETTEQQTAAESESETETTEQRTDTTTAVRTETKKTPAKKSAVKKTTAKKTVKKKKVKKKATIKIRKKSASLEKGDTLRLRAKIKNSSTKKIIWKSSRKSVATVNKKGQVTAKRKGRTVITARISGTNIKAKCVIRVKNYITMRMRTTGYCNCSSCAGIWAGARTASGTRPKEKRTIAVDKRLIRLGTKVGIGNEMYVAEDTGGAIKGKRIDVYYASHSKAMAHGVKYQNVRVYY